MKEKLRAILEKTSPSIVLFLFFFSLYALTMSGRIQYGDEVEKYRVAQSIVERGEFSFRPTAMRDVTGSGGQTYSIYELGQTVAEIPLYALSKWINAIFPLPDVNARGFLLVGFLNPLAIALACVVFFKSCESLGYRRRTSIALTLVFGLGTIVWPYAKGFAREPLLTLFLLLSFYFVHRFQKTLGSRWLLVAGLALGYLAFTKLIQGVSIPIFLVYVWVLIFLDRRQAGVDRRGAAWALVKGSVIFLLPFIVFMALQSLYALARFGTIYSGIGGTKLNPVDWILFLLPQSQPGTALIGVLFSPDKSFFLYSPPALLLLVAWFKWLHADKKLAFLFLALIGVAFLSVITRPDWDGGTWWGERYLVQITPIFILPLGILESSSETWRRRWTAALGILFVLGFGVQVVGAFSSPRDHLDIEGYWITLAGAIDFLRHGALDSLVLYLSPQGFPIQINPYGIVLMLMIALLGAWVIWRIRHTDFENASPRAGWALAAFVLLGEFGAFILWLVVPYPQVLAAQGNTDFVAANSFLADGRQCEATALYALAIQRGTTYQHDAVAQLAALLPRPRGTHIAAGDLLANKEISGTATIEVDPRVTITGDGSLRASAPAGTDVIARGHANPIPVLPDTTYEVSGWIQTENIYGEGNGSVAVYEDDGAYRNIHGTDIVNVGETNGWTRFQKTLTTLSTTHRLFVAAGLWNTYGTVWIDGLQVAQITQQNPASPAIQPCQ